MDALLTSIIGFTQLLLGAMGVYVSLRPPKPEHHWRWIAGFMGIGLLGIGLTGYLSIRAEKAQESATLETHNAEVAATGANTEATDANRAATAAGQETLMASVEAREANESLTKLINQRAQETTTAILQLDSKTQSSIKGISAGPPPRRIPPENRPQLVRFLSAKPSKARLSVTASDAEAYRFAQDWYEVLKAAGWTIDGDSISSFISAGEPSFGIVVTFHGEPVLPNQQFQVSNLEPAGYIVQALNVLKVSATGRRLPDVEENLVILNFYAHPPAN